MWRLRSLTQTNVQGKISSADPQGVTLRGVPSQKRNLSSQEGIWGNVRRTTPGMTLQRVWDFSLFQTL